jgi:hypothetical protein
LTDAELLLKSSSDRVRAFEEFNKFPELALLNDNPEAALTSLIGDSFILLISSIDLKELELRLRGNLFRVGGFAGEFELKFCDFASLFFNAPSEFVRGIDLVRGSIGDKFGL